MKKRIGVVADDVTGANDIGVMFRKGGYRSAVFPLSLLSLCDLKEECEELDAVIIDTGSRLMIPGQRRTRSHRPPGFCRSCPATDILIKPVRCSAGTSVRNSTACRTCWVCPVPW